MRTLLTIWTQPIETFEYLDNNKEPNLKFNLNVLFYLSALGMTLPQIPQFILKYQFLNEQPIILSVFLSLLAFLISALLTAWFFKHVHSFMLWITGKALQGKASKAQVQLVLAYALIPGLVNLFLSCMLIIVALFMNDIDIIGYQNPFTLFILWILGMRTLIYGIARFNRFSYGYALMNSIASVALIQGILLFIKYLIH